MEGVSAGVVSEAWWSEACKKMKNAVVFLDVAVTESLHWSGGLDRLAQAGAKNVKEFSSFERGNESDQKGVFIVSESVLGTTATILHDIVQASRFQYCVVISCAHPSVLSYARYGGRDADENTLLAELERDVLTWMGNMNYTVEVLYFPLVVVPYSKSLFFTPLFSKLQPLLQSDVPRLTKLNQAMAKTDKVRSLENLGEVEFSHLPHDLRVLIRQLVSCVHSLLQGMNAREEIYTLGHTARIIGTELDAFTPARLRRKTASNKVSLVLVDRSLDVVGAASHGGTTGTLMGRILDLLPRLPGHQIDSAVNMSPLCSVHPSAEWTLVPGCLAPQGKEEQKADQVLKSLITASEKETLTLINKHVLEATCRKKQDSDDDDDDDDDDGKGRITVDKLKNNIQQFASDVDAFTDNAAILQQGLAAVECLSDPRFSHLDQLLSLEKSITQSFSDQDETPPFTQIFQILKTRKSHGVSLDEVLSLMVYTVSLGGPEALNQRDEYTLVNLLSQALVEDRENLSDTLINLVGEEVDEVSALKTAQTVAEQLHALATARQHLTNYRQVHEPGTSVQPAEYQGLLRRLVRDCLTPPQGEITDLEYKSAGLKDLIKTGFRLFVSVSKPMPRDAQTMLVYVIGGVSAGEVKEFEQEVASVSPSCRVVLASSHLTYAQDIITRILRPNPYLQ
ncbi:hypothetical protein Pmani_020555 [Petrolisthes manimaculis]|uniref:Sec1 family domain-containing protein 2 n=1 Tax=Petrolisthes manimaculis TaxID=1843537 RepID=A0AAE1PI53_9EUCA|nr:hypothetical protein Pmani_020555 [Petrolisthes manimaculis]